jgi:hypothetical protein
MIHIVKYWRCLVKLAGREERWVGGFDALSKAEQVRYLQALWDQISEDPSTVPVPESHLRLAEERLKRYHQDLLRAHSAFEVLARLADTSSTDSESE